MINSVVLIYSILDNITYAVHELAFVSAPLELLIQLPHRHVLNHLDVYEARQEGH